MSVPQYTTPTFTMTFTDQGVNLLEADSVYVTFRSKLSTLTKTGEDLILAEKSVGVHLTQSETAKFTGSVEIQVNWTVGTERIASNIATYNISDQLLKKVI